MRSFGPRFVRLFALAAACFVAAGTAGVGRASGPRDEAGLDHVVLQLKWTNQFQFAGYYAAIARGYYRDAGLSVELREASPGHDPSSEVVSGRAEFGVGNADVLLLRDRGKQVVVLADIFQHSPLILLARRQPGVEDIQSLADKPMMIEPLSAELFAYFKNEGVDPAKLHLIPHSFDIRDLLSGKVAAISAYSTDEPYQMRVHHVPYLTFTPRAGGIDFYGDNIFTTEAQVRDHPERVARFREASLRGWDYAMAHQSEMVDLIQHDYHVKKSREALLFEAARTADLMHPELIEIGHSNPGRWEHILATYQEFGMASRTTRLEGFIYDPNPPPNLTWLYWALGLTSLATIGTLGWALPLVRLNRGLRREKERAEAADRAKSAYVAVMTHEVRSPMAVILGYVELLKSERLTDDQRKQVDSIDRNAQRLLGLVNDVLDFAKFENGHIEFESVPMSVADVVSELCEQFAPAARAKGVELTCNVEPSVPAAVRGDPARLRQIVTNLLSNATKFTEKGTIEVRVSAVREEPAHVRLILRVRDTGIGIAADGLERIFDPYAQADPSIARRYGGTGLGLAIVRRIARGLGGEVEVTSTPGTGTTFTVTLVTATGT